MSGAQLNCHFCDHAPSPKTSSGLTILPHWSLGDIHEMCSELIICIITGSLSVSANRPGAPQGQWLYMPCSQCIPTEYTLDPWHIGIWHVLGE